MRFAVPPLAKDGEKAWLMQVVYIVPKKRVVECLLKQYNFNNLCESRVEKNRSIGAASL